MEVVNTFELFKEERESLGETNDCVVRAIAIAYGMSYKEAHRYCRVYLNRGYRAGVRILEEFNGEDHLSKNTTPYAFNERCFRHCKHTEKVDCTGNKGVGKIGLYLKKFIEKCDKNSTYIILSSGHAYCVKNGKVYGNPEDCRTYVKLAYKLK